MKDTLEGGGTAMDARRGAAMRHIGRCIAVLGIVIAMIVGTAGVAAAAGLGQQTCRTETNKYTICFQVSTSGLGFQVHIGLDVYMSQADAKKILEAPESTNGRYQSGLYGADFILDDILGSPRTSLTASWERGLSVEWSDRFLRSTLDEDWDGRDELFALVWIVVPSLGIDRQFRTNEVTHSF